MCRPSVGAVARVVQLLQPTLRWAAGFSLAQWENAGVMSTVHYYSMRQLSPYQGTVQIVELPGFRAMSIDGGTWQVQALRQPSRFAVYGVWRAGASQIIDNEHTHALLAALENHPPLPFALADQLELWLLDATEEHLPLALLASTLPQRSPPRVTQAVWHPTLEGDTSFVAPSLSAFSVAALPHRDLIAQRVREAAGPLACAQWFARDADGHGLGRHGLRIGESFIGRHLDADWFPELLVSEDWDAARDRDLVRDFHDWQAPQLLTHPNLSRTTRARLERAACRQAEKLYALRALLPEVIEHDRVQTAFVEAVIRRSARPMAVSA